jgi:hypothetical protein
MGRGLSLVLERSALMSLPEVYARARFEANDELVELLGAPPAFSLRPAQTRTFMIPRMKRPSPM